MPIPIHVQDSNRYQSIILEMFLARQNQVKLAQPKAPLEESVTLWVTLLAQPKVPLEGLVMLWVTLLALLEVLQTKLAALLAIPSKAFKMSQVAMSRAV